MISKAYLLTSAVIFALVAISHFIRLVNHWSIAIGTVTFPFWGSWLAVICASALSIWAVRLATKWTTSPQ
jgi:hypothetical protein